MIKGVTFDFGGTLADGKLNEPLFRGRLLDYLHSSGFSGGETRLGRIINGEIEKLNRVRKLNKEIKIEDLYASVLSKLGLNPENHMLEYIHELYVSSFDVDVVPGAEDVLEYLKNKYRLALISNASSEIPRYAIRKFGLEKYFEVVVVSRDIGVRKPDPEIFRFTLKKLELTSCETVHVGDSIYSDVAGAKNTGMKAILVDKRQDELELPDHLEKVMETTKVNFPSIKDVKPDYIINSVIDLMNVL
ncbi:MAG: HAD family hydrolase [Candidatus Bathyarchaeia archaeon]